jgi:hypothetical protein
MKLRAAGPADLEGDPVVYDRSRIAKSRRIDVFGF